MWMGLYLDATTKYRLVIPPGFGHSYLTLKDQTILGYQMNCSYDVSKEIGFRYDDPAICIKWPLTPKIVSDKDLSWDFISDK
jgi:dTDP-4-dehydrorhamnose 3,5-epimerase